MRGDLGRWEIARRVNLLLTLCRPGPPVNGLLSAAARGKKRLYTEPWKRRGMGQLCCRSPAPWPPDKGRTESGPLLHRWASCRRRRSGNVSCTSNFYFRFVFLKVCCQCRHAQVTESPSWEYQIKVFMKCSKQKNRKISSSFIKGVFYFFLMNEVSLAQWDL